MPGRHRRLVWVAAALLVIGAAVFGGWRHYDSGPPRLGPTEADTTLGLDAKVGERLNAMIAGFHPHGPDPVRVRAVRVTGLPRGLRLVGIHALESGGGGGALGGDLQKDYPGKFEYRPVTDIVFNEGEREGWNILVIVEALEPGDWKSTGLDIDWSAGRRRGTTHFTSRVGMIVRP